MEYGELKLTENVFQNKNGKDFHRLEVTAQFRLKEWGLWFQVLSQHFRILQKTKYK
jgi:hypothetical protein